MLETGRDDTRHWQKRLIQSESIPSSRHWINTGRKTKIVRFVVEANVSTRTKGRIKILTPNISTQRPMSLWQMMVPKLSFDYSQA